mgnify:CR=1 FL=1
MFLYQTIISDAIFNRDRWGIMQGHIFRVTGYGSGFAGRLPG